MTKSAGFSLIELLVVMVIIGLLGGLVGPRLFNQVDASKVEIARTQIKMLKAALQVYRLDNGRYPTNSEGLNSLIVRPATLGTWRGPYLEEELLDLGKAFQLQLVRVQFSGFCTIIIRRRRCRRWG